MPLNVIIGPAQSGKKQELFARFRASLNSTQNISPKNAQYLSPDKTPYLLVPSAPEAAFIRKELLQKNQALIGATVITYNRFLQQLAQKAGINQNVIDPIQQDFIIRRIVDTTSLSVLTRSSEYAGFGSAITSFLNELKEGMVTPDALENAFSKWDQTFRSKAYLNDILALYRAYLDELNRSDLLDEQMLRWEIVNALENGEIVESSPLFLYGFDDFTTSQRRIIDLLSTNTEVTFALMYEDTDAFAERKKQVEELLKAAEGNVTWMEHATNAPAPISVPSSTSSTSSTPEAPHLLAPHFLVAAGNRGEVELVGAKILELLRSGQYKPDDIAVILRDPNRFKKTITNIFEDFSIPYSFNEPVSFGHTQLGRALMALLGFCHIEPAATELPAPSKQDTKPVSKLVSYLRIRYAGKQNLIDKFEREVRIKKIVGTQGLLTAWQNASGMRVEEIDRLLETSGFAETIACIRFVSAIVMDSMLSGENNDESPAFSYHTQANLTAFTELEKALQSLETMVAIAPHLTPSPVDALSAIKNTLDRIEIRIGREAEAGKVHVLRVHRSRGRSYKAVFVLGLNDGFFPKSTSDDPFFNLNERIQLANLGLELDAKQNNIAEERYLFYVATTRASEELYLSYQSVDSDANKLLKSSFIVDLEASLKSDGVKAPVTGRSLSSIVFDGDTVPIPSAREALRFASSIYREDRSHARDIATIVGSADILDNAISNAPSPKPAFNSERVKGFVADRDTFSVSEIKAFAYCPFRWFVERTLKPQKLDIELDALNKGSIQHEVLEEFYRALPARLGVSYPAKDSLERAENFIEEIFETVFEREAADKESIEARFGKHEMLENLKRFVRTEAMRSIKQPAGFVPSLFEASFGMKSDTHNDEHAGEHGEHKEECLTLTDEVKIRGKIDRIDTDASGRAIVLDYKSNSISGAKDIESCDDLQIPVYIKAVKQLWELNPIAGGYLSIAKGTNDGLFNSDIIDIDEIFLPDNAARDNETFQLIIENALAKICEIAAEIKAGGFAPTTDEAACRKCDLPHICRKDRV